MPIFRKDPCGIVCVAFTYVFILYAGYVVTNWIVMQALLNSLWGTVHAILYNTVAFLAICAHVRAVFSDPGIVPLTKSTMSFSDMRSGAEENSDWTICGKCDMYRPPRAHHCRVCQRCIRRMDHHCPWINNCVGELNQKYFLQFLIYIGLMALYGLSLIAYTWVTECATCSQEIMVKQTRLMHCVILTMESILFGLFVFAIMWDQIESIWTDETAVEQVKKQGPYRPKRSKYYLMREVCGRTHPCLWIFPCTSSPQTNEVAYALSI